VGIGLYADLRTVQSRLDGCDRKKVFDLYLIWNSDVKIWSNRSWLDNLELTACLHHFLTGKKSSP